ncbi:MAG TPA: alkaline phosphatase family protein [Polyangiaceae bacterium]|jgi:phospholipase C
MRSIVRKSLVRHALLIGVAGVAATAVAQVGCSSTNTSSPPGGANGGSQDNVGTVGMQLTLPGGETLAVVNWTVTGPGGASTIVQSGSVNVAGSQSISFLVGGIPAGSGYSIMLTSTTTDGNVSCSGSATFNVSARTTTNVSVALQCVTAGSNNGSISVNGTTYDCATWNSATASPSETTVGNAVTVSASASGPNPAALTYAWSAPSGTFAAPTSASTQFTCTTPGPVTLTLTVADGPIPAGASCSTSLDTTTVQVTCDGHLDQAAQLATATKIKHVVVIFGENISFDHYFGTYPNAQNLPGEPSFVADPATPAANGLSTPLNPIASFAPVTGVDLLNNNPNLNPANGTGAANPFRLAPLQAATNDQGHNYNPEQQASDHGLMDLFPEFTGTAGPPPGAPPAATTKGLVMAYFDGNTLNSYWGYAQENALNDNSWTTVFGPSTPGAIDLISGQTNGFSATNKGDGGTFSSSHAIADGNGGLTMIGDTDPLGDVCSTAADQNLMSGKNIGDLLNTGSVTWGWFEGGFDLTATNANGTTGCNRSTPQTVPNAPSTSTDYIPHHAPFQYYASTANPTHARPSSVAAIGNADVANHQYDTNDFFATLSAGNLPAVTYLKAPGFQDGHAGYSNPIDEQTFIVNVVNALQASQEWASTAIVLAYDDSDGWYDHQAPPIVNPSTSVADGLNGAGLCNTAGAQQGSPLTTPLLGAVPAGGGAALPAQGRCGYGTRIPMMVISPFAKHNFIDHTLTDQTSILRFIEDNWLGGQRVQPGGSFDTIANSITGMLTGI